MMSPFNLWRSIDPRRTTHHTDVENTKKALHFLGLYRIPKGGITGTSDEAMIEGLKNFQSQRGLEPDGVMTPDGPTHLRMKEALSAHQSVVDARQTAVAGKHREPALRTNEIVTKKPTSRQGANPDARFAAYSRQQSISDRFNVLGETRSIGHSDPADAPSIGRGSTAQLAVAPAAAAFFVWLADYLGLATVSAAIVIYLSQNKAWRDAVRKKYEEQDGDDGDFCRRRFQEEYDRCTIWPKKWLGGCRERATDRYRLCLGNGGVPHPKEPLEWGPDDMEVSPPR